MIKWWDCAAVRCGFWYNEENNPISRGTLTLPNEWGLILASFFALFITLSGGYLWGTITFLVHQINASSKPQDDSYHQFQLVLRNTDNEQALINQLSKFARAHKHRRTKAWYKSIALMIFAGLYGLGFNLIGGFSTSIIAARDSSVLSVSRHCGWFTEPLVKNSKDFSLNTFYSFELEQLYEYVSAVSVMTRNVFRRSAGYSRSCYGRFGDNSTACSNYVRPSLPYNITRDLPCPFSQAICDGLAISLDSGPIRSDTDLGVNTRPEDAISVRKVLTCVPLAAEKYTDGWQQLPPEHAVAMNVPQGTQVKAYKFGPYSNWALDPVFKNYTAGVDEVAWHKGKQPYSLLWRNAILDLPFNPSWEHFTPIPDLQNISADTTIVGLTNRMYYATAINDPWFRADNCTITDWTIIPERCKATTPLSFLGCQDQYQFCKAASPSSNHVTAGSVCTPLTGLFKLYPDIFLAKGTPWNGTELPDLNPTQKAVYNLLAKAIAGSQLNWQLGFIGHDNLIANDYLWDNGFGFEMSAPLPSNQWEIEVMNWMNVSLANTQRSVVAYGRRNEYDVGGGVSSLQYIDHPQDPEMRSLCNKMKVRSASHTSFSVLAMSATIAFGLFCVVSDLLARKLFRCVQRRSGHGRYKTQEWSDSSVFQLQRMAAEGKGIGPWEGKDKDVPTLVDRGLRFNLVNKSRFGHVESTSYDNDQNDNGFRYKALPKNTTLQEEVQLRTFAS